MRKTKIICTLGPSTDKDGVLEELIKEGMNVARFNFSHGLHDEQKGRIDKLKEIRTRLNKPVAAQTIMTISFSVSKKDMISSLLLSPEQQPMSKRSAISSRKTAATTSRSSQRSRTII